VSESYEFSQGPDQTCDIVLTWRIPVVWKIRVWVSQNKRTEAKQNGLPTHVGRAANIHHPSENQPADLQYWYISHILHMINGAALGKICNDHIALSKFE